jgi:heat-inducible transcriptional repressor
VHRTVRLLAQLTHQVAVVQYPSLSRSSVRHLEVVHISDTRVLVVLITDTGRVEQRMLDLPGMLTEDGVAELRTLFNARIAGCALADAPGLLADLPDMVAPTDRANVVAVLSTVLEALVEHPEERVVLAGRANLARTAALDFPGTIRPVLEALEEQVVVLRLLAAQQEAGKVTVRIGHETEAEEMASTSVVSTAYGSSGKVYGGMGVLGPTRMDYPGTIANVAAVALYIGEVLGSR